MVVLDLSFDKLLAEIFAFKVKLSNTFATTVRLPPNISVARFVVVVVLVVVAVLIFVDVELVVDVVGVSP